MSRRLEPSGPARSGQGPRMGRRRAARPAGARWGRRAAWVLLAVLAVSCAEVRRSPRPVIQRGVASWYGPGFHGRPTASGERFDQEAMTAAHKTLPFGTVVEVRNLDNGRSVRVTINDRGPFVRGRIIDLSRGAARRIEMIGPGTARVELALVTEPRLVAAAAGPYAVQIGAFRDHERAEALRELLARRFPRAEVRTGEGWYRVQVGRFEERRRAERLRAEVVELGWEGAVVVAVE